MNINKTRELQKEDRIVREAHKLFEKSENPTTNLSSSLLENPQMQSSSPIPLSELPLSNPVSLPAPSYRKSKAAEPLIFNRKTKKRMITPDVESDPGSPHSPENYEYVAEKGYAPFVKKLYDILDKPAYESIIYWCEDGKSFEVANQFEFCDVVLPYYYKHKNMSSFVRQLNLYGFTKIQNLRQGVLNAGADSEKYKFMHPKFQRGRPELLGHVKRKLSDGSKEVHRYDNPMLDLSHVYSELDSLKKLLRSTNEQLKEVQSTNEELSKTNQQVILKYHEQNTMIHTILQFLKSFLRDKQLEKLPRKQHLLLERPSTEESYPPALNFDQPAYIQKLIQDLSNNHSGISNELWLNDPTQYQYLDFNNQEAQQGALVPSSPRPLAQAARLAGISQGTNPNLKRVAGSVDNSIAGGQDLLGDKVSQEQGTSLATTVPEFLSPYIGTQPNFSADYAPLLYDLRQYDFHPDAMASASGAANPLAGFEHASGALGLGLGTPANGDALLANLSNQLPFNEEVSEIITEPHPALSSTPGSSASTVFGSQNLS